jgi:hypothetical protein
MTGFVTDVGVHTQDRLDEPTTMAGGRHTCQQPKVSARHRAQCVRTNTSGSLNSTRMSRELTLKTAAREYVWLYDYRHGVSVGEIASRDRVSIQRVEFGVGRARAQEKETNREGIHAFLRSTAGPHLVPLFPIGHYTPQSQCPHKEPIESGSSLCCMVCHQSGVDKHPSLQRDARTDPAPDPAPTLGDPATEPPLQQGETRKQRRHRTFTKRI